jgi:hypothetical protein
VLHYSFSAKPSYHRGSVDITIGAR